MKKKYIRHLRIKQSLKMIYFQSKRENKLNQIKLI